MAINSLSSSSKGISGLVSGMDTQQMVEALLKGTQTKIDKQTQKRTQLTYKQELYQSIIGKINSFKDSYYGSTAKSTNIWTDSFFNTMSAITNSLAYKVTASSDAAAGKTTVDYVKQLAQSLTKKSNTKATGELAGKFDKAALQKVLDEAEGSLTFTVGDKSVKIDNVAEMLAGKTNEEAEILLNQKFETEGLNIKASYLNGKFTFKSDEKNAAGGPATISIGGDKSALAIFGATDTFYSTTGSLSKTMTLSALQPNINITYNGVQKAITFDYNRLKHALEGTPPTGGSTAEDPAAALADELQKSIDKAFGHKIEVKNTNGKISFDAVIPETDSSGNVTYKSDPTSTISIIGRKNNMDMLGIVSNQSNKITTGLALNTINFKTPLYGDNFRFTINGVDFNVSGDRSLKEIINEINSSEAGVTISYNQLEDRFSIASKISGAGTEIKMSQTEGNLLSALFGVQSGGTTTGRKLSAHQDIVGSSQFKLPADYKGGELKLTVNGTEYRIKVLEKDKDGNEIVYDSPEKFVTQINKQLAEAFGKNEGDVGNIRFEYDSTSEMLTLSSERGYNITVANQETADFLGITKDATTTPDVTGDTKLSLLGFDMTNFGITINGTTISGLTGDSTINDLVAKLNTELSAQGSGGTAEFKDGYIKIFGVEIPMAIRVAGDNGQLLGGGVIDLNTPPAGGGMTIVKQGQNAILSINNVEIERDSNNFTIEGLTFELTDVTKPSTDSSGNPISQASTITVTRDTDKIYDGLSKFVEDYNKLVDEISSLTSADATYKDYPPLTAAQKEQMSDREVELWETKSKEGLLRGDETLTSFMQQMRTALYTKPADSSLPLYGMGITTKFSYTDKSTGKLEINEDKLRKAITENVDEVRKLFTSEDGLGKNLEKIIDSAAATSYSKPGKLVRIAGAKGYYDTSSTIYKQIKEINESLDKLEDTYTNEYQRYWKQFNAMEQMIANMNNQSSWLSQQFS